MELDNGRSVCRVAHGCMAAALKLSEQFVNAKLVEDVLQIGVKVLKAGGGVVDKETVKESVESVVGGEEESLGTRKRAKKYQAKARATIEEGG